MTRRQKWSREEIAAAKARVALSALVGSAVVLKRRAGKLWGLCPFHREKTPSFTVDDGRGAYHCFGCGAHGDVFDWLAHIEGLGFGAAAARLMDEAGLTHDVEARARAEAEVRRAEAAREREAEVRARRAGDRALEMWRARRPIAGSVVEAYLVDARGISRPDGGWPPSLGFLANDVYWEPDSEHHLSRWPVMIAALQRFDAASGKSAIVGVHRTFLAVDGSGKAPVRAAKKMLGAAAGAAVRLGPAARRLHIAEGIETGLSVASARPGAAVWVAGSLDNMVGFARGRGVVHPLRPGQRLPGEEPDLARPGLVVPPMVREVVLVADNDSSDPPALRARMRRGERKFCAQGRSVWIVWPDRGHDANDYLRRDTAVQGGAG